MSAPERQNMPTHHFMGSPPDNPEDKDLWTDHDNDDPNTSTKQWSGGEWVTVPEPTQNPLDGSAVVQNADGSQSTWHLE
jgi:hypothetical protein